MDTINKYEALTQGNLSTGGNQYQNTKDKNNSSSNNHT